MALRAQLESLEGLPEPVAKEYKKVEQDGKVLFLLDVDIDNLDSVGALKRAKDHEKKERQTVESRFKEASTKIETLQDELDNIRRGAIPKGDVEKLEGSWKDKLAKREAELIGERDAAIGTLQRLLVDNVAQAVATKVSTAPDLLLPHVKARLVAEKTSDGYVTRVLDKEGKPSAMSIEELQKELSGDKRFAAIIVGSKASGGGASGGNDGGSGAPRSFDPAKFDITKASAAEVAAYLKMKKETKT